jgi:hypothetical protein
LSIISKSLKLAAVLTGYLTPYSDPLAKLLRIFSMINLVKTPAKAQVRAAKFVSLVGQSQKLMYGLAAYLALVIVLLNLG